ncbi:MAG: glutathione S-transferase family protein [Rhodospirillales bacterium]|nr:MAG: glutathione S-transferase family protein [Rhodospirillales bacterium]
MLTLYHYDRSTAAQRVRLLLEEKQLPWESVIVDTARGDVEELPEDYHRLNPKGLVPVIVNDGAGIAESLVILEYLEDALPEPSFRPLSPEARARMRLWMRKIDDGVHVASRTIGVCLVNRHIYEAKSAGKIEKYYAEMRDEVRRTNDQINIAGGLDSPLLPDAVATFRRLFEEIDKTLAQGAWLAGETYSLADIALVVYVRRMESFMMAPLWRHLGHLNDWYTRIAERPAYRRAVESWGDVTAEQRREHGKAAFPRIAELWGN